MSENTYQIPDGWELYGDGTMAELGNDEAVVELRLRRKPAEERRDEQGAGVGTGHVGLTRWR